MIESVELKTIRDYIQEKDESFSVLLNYLWNVSRTLHDLQNQADGTENGQKHVEMVEHNIWRLINETGKLGEFNTTELFLLSAAACCHDFGKALKYNKDTVVKIFKHGANSADFLRNNLKMLGLIQCKHLAEAICKIIEIHDLKGNEFAKKVRKLKRKGEATSTETIKHQLLAVLLKTADILHTDSSRIQKLAVKFEELSDLNKSKYLARDCIKGWAYEGNRIIIQARIQSDEENDAIQACQKFMLIEEWLPVSELLENHDLPHILAFETEENIENGGTVMPPSNEKTLPPDIPLDGEDRYLREEVTDSMLRTAIKRIERFPLCRNVAATHAAGTATASLAVFIMLYKINCFKDDFITKSNEFIVEEKYIPKKLAEHISSLSQPQSLLSRIIDDGPSNPDRKIENTLKKTLQNLPGGDDLYKGLRSIHVSIREIINEMNRLYDNIKKEIKESRPTSEEMECYLESEKWKKLIQQLFEPKKQALLKLRDELDEIIRKVESIGDAINEDWDRDINRIWDVEKFKHRPKGQENH